ncbi:MAG TPA: GatB/YqeY domain-containing protein [Myxococcales bacterium]|nr:GatB/YqeY domain-containing protein [Myxococcales bacterium]
MLVDRIDQDMKAAARAKEARRLNTIRMLKSQMKYREIEKGSALDEGDVLAVIGSMIKQRKDSAAQYTAGRRPELAENENAEIAILEAYLPRQLTDAELSELVQESVAAAGAKGPRDMGAVMKALMPKVAGRAEGKRVSEAVKAALSKLSQ